MGKISVGCQTYTWEMLGKEWKGTIEDMLAAIAAAGYQGVEITNTMLGPMIKAPDTFQKLLQSYRLAFPSLGFVPRESFTDEKCRGDELQRAKEGIDFVSRFPGCRLDLAGGSAPDREKLKQRFATMCAFYNEVGVSAQRKGVSVDVHPHSHHGSIIETAEEYEQLMTMTDPKLVGWCPDTGHIVRGGLDLLGTLRKYSVRIRNIHLKDADEAGKWRPLGQGICDFPGVMRFLEEIGYGGWIIGEEESPEAFQDQRAAIEKNRRYLRTIGY
jgi:sugar phosphate isomerase/epimerase